MSIAYRFFMFLALAVLTLNYTPSVSAQEESFGIEEIIVTARKVEESSQSVPVAITAITEDLRRSSIRDLNDINGFAPNVIIAENGSRSGGGAEINIRGISPTRGDDNSFDPPIGVMLDGVYFERCYFGRIR